MLVISLRLYSIWKVLYRFHEPITITPTLSYRQHPFAPPSSRPQHPLLVNGALHSSSIGIRPCITELPKPVHCLPNNTTFVHSLSSRFLSPALWLGRCWKVMPGYQFGSINLGRFWSGYMDGFLWPDFWMSWRDKVVCSTVLYRFFYWPCHLGLTHSADIRAPVTIAMGHPHHARSLLSEKWGV